MAATETSIHDYSTGVPRRHHSLYIEDGSLVFQVENAIFKVHRSFLVKYSPVIKDMLDVPQSGETRAATDEMPLVLAGDNASAWELLLESHYDSPPLSERHAVGGEQLLAILRVAHKYCMEVIEEAIVKQLKAASTTTAAYVKLMVASQIVDSKPLYDEALNGLRSSRPRPNFTEASSIGFRAYFEVMDQAIISCRNCHNPVIHCHSCGTWDEQ